MPTYIIEREIPGAGQLTDDELRGITTKSNDVVSDLSRPYTWRHSYVAGDKIYCVHEAAFRRLSSRRSRGSSTARVRGSFRSERVIDSGHARGRSDRP